MATPTTGPNSYQTIPVYNAVIPKEGPKALPVTCNFATISTYDIDLTLAQTQQRISVVQALFCDNSSNGSEVSITASGLAQTVIVPPYSQAYLPFLCPKPTIITAVSVNSTATVLIVFLNVPTPAQVWDVLGSGLVPSGGSASAFTPIAGLVGGTGAVQPVNVDSYGNVQTSNIGNSPSAIYAEHYLIVAGVEPVTINPSVTSGACINVAIQNNDATNPIYIYVDVETGGSEGFELTANQILTIPYVPAGTSLVADCFVTGATVQVSIFYGQGRI